MRELRKAIPRYVLSEAGIRPRGETSSGTSALRQRHGYATAWLIFVIIANAGVVLLYLVTGSEISRRLPAFPEWALPVLIICGLLNIVFSVALLAWKQWGFYGFAIMSVLIFLVNIVAGLGAQGVAGLVGIVILYVVLQIGGERSTWKQLR